MPDLHRFLLMLLMLALPVQALCVCRHAGLHAVAAGAVQPMAMADDMMAGCHEPEQPDTPHLPA